jgi:hypothetical protein
MDKKRAKIKKDEYLRKLNEATKDLPMSKEGSPIVEEMKHGGMAECRGGGIAISGKKFEGVF